MLNKSGNRELVYVTKVARIEPIEGADKVELAVIGAGWQVMVKKSNFTQAICASILKLIQRSLKQNNLSFFLNIITK